MKQLTKFISDQLSVWPMASANFRALRKDVKTKILNVNGLDVKVQFNPCRVASSTADTSPEVIAARPCFLCSHNRPKEQKHLIFEGRKGRRYRIQINPFPIFPNHLVIVRDNHIPQVIWHHFPDMLDFCRKYPDFTVFYNGPQSGASAPDHLHFQACPRSLMPVEQAVDAFLDAPGEPLATNKDAAIYHYPHYTHGIFALRSATAKSLTKLFYRLLCCCDAAEMTEEPRFNVFAWYNGSEFRTMVMLRGELRSHHYASDGPDHLSISPGAADMGGVFIAPFEDDFNKVAPSMLEEMLSEVSVPVGIEEAVLRRLTRKQRKLDIGIMAAPSITFEILSDGAGAQEVRWCDGQIAYNGMLYDELYFESVTRSTLFAEPTFVLKDVLIGKEFHWQQKRTLSFAGSLKFIVEGKNVVAVNHIGIENYLLSVISSEMKSSAGLELLKAHAVISRSWALSNLGRHGCYDLCADDHCQRYQGLTMAVGDKVRMAIDQTWGEVLKYDGKLCDTRYSKCCGGITERFSSCWEDVDFPYLESIKDAPEDGGRDFCDCEDAAILSQVLNDYDLETRDFYRWEQRYDKSEISSLVKEKTSTDLGEIQELVPLETGPSGRISRLLINGGKGSLELGKELAIRRALSPSHLKSSAFESCWEGDTLILRGKGWGHGVGLCQIGAAVMAANGYDYRQILAHYYRGSEVE